MTPILAGKKFTPPIKGQADVEFIAAGHQARRETVVTTRFKVKNISTAPIARLHDRRDLVRQGRRHRRRRQGRRRTACSSRAKSRRSTIETPYNAKMNANNWNFSHANGTVKPQTVAEDRRRQGAEAAAKNAPPKK